MKKGVAWLMVLALAGVTAAAAQEIKTETDKTVYTIGQMIGRRVQNSIKDLDLTKAEQAIFMAALEDYINGAKPKVDMTAYYPKVTEFAQTRLAARAEAQKKDAPAYLEKAAKAPGAVKTDSGLIYTEIKAGTGPSPKVEDTVKVNYRGTLMDGTEFDSTYKMNLPAEFPLGGVIQCWSEGLQKMKVGGKAKLVCPASIGYGERGGNGIPGNAPLTFEVELLSIQPKPAAPAGAPPAAKPPAVTPPGAKPPASK